MPTCTACGAELPSGARFCPGCGAPVAEHEPTQESLRLVTVLFADVVGSTARAEAMHPEDIRALMSDYFGAMAEEIRAEGGTIEKFIGDAIMAVFGVPAAHEDDPVRAVRAARRMLAQLERWNEGRSHPLEIRIGIDTGEVIAAGSAGRELLVTGDAVNVAARLQQAAEPGTVLVGERTSRLARRFFSLEPVRPLDLKGKADPVATWRVLEELEDAAPRGLPGMATPLVGRETELDLLRTTFARVRDQASPHLVTILADAGIGKSRLVREVVGTLEVESKVLVGRCLAYGEGVTLWPLGEMLKAEAVVLENDPPGVARAKIRELVAAAIPAELAEDPESTAAALASTIGLEGPEQLDPRDAYRALLRAWRALLTALGRASPAVVVVEDIHWADATMLDVLEDLSEHVEAPVLLLCTARPDLQRSRPGWGGGKRNFSALPLDPLTPEESSRLVSLLLDVEELPADLRDRILARSEGNPFFLEEIVRRLLDEELLVREDGRWRARGAVGDLEIPDDVQGVILARIDLLAADEKRALQQAAVVGRTFWRGAVARLASDERLDEVLETLCRRELVLERLSSSMAGETEYVFKHVLIRDVAYETLPRRERARAHAEAAAWIEELSGERAEELGELLAHHYDVAFSLAGGDELRRRARRYSLIASRKAVRRFALKQGARFGHHAVELSRGRTERVEALEALGDDYAHYDAGGAWEAYSQAIRELEDDDRAALGRLAAKAALGPTRFVGSLRERPPAAEIEELIERGLDAAGPGDSFERSLLLSARTFLQIMGFQRRDDRGAAAAREALAIAERLGDPMLVSVALDAGAGLLIPDGRDAERYELTLRRLRLVPELTDSFEIGDILANAAWSANAIGRYRDAIEHATGAIEHSRAAAGPYLHGLTWRVLARFAAGDWDDALVDQAEIEEIQRDREDGLPAGYTQRAYSTTALLHELRGGREHADEYLELIARCHSQGERSRRFQTGAFGNAGRALVHRGLLDEARQYVSTQTGEVGPNLGSAVCDLIAAEERWDEAEKVVAVGRAAAEERGLRPLVLTIDRLEGLWREEPEALRRSAEGFAELGAVWEEAFSRLLLAELTGERDEAERALAVFERLGSVAEIVRAKEAASARRGPV
jgi:predicted ATPase/class 3 adenylate cyclase